MVDGECKEQEVEKKIYSTYYPDGYTSNKCGADVKHSCGILTNTTTAYACCVNERKTGKGCVELKKPEKNEM